MSQVLALLDRARYDIQQGWYAAALDALARAATLLRESESA